MPSLTRAALPLCHLRLQSRHSGRGLDCLRGSGEVAPSAPPTLHLVVNSPAPPFSSAQITPTGSAIRCFTLIPWAICRAGEESQISTTVTRPSRPWKSLLFRVTSGRSSARAVAAISRSANLRQGWRPWSTTAACIRPYARADRMSNGIGSNVASVRCRRSCRRARSEVSVVAEGPAESSANVTVDIATSAGSRKASSRSRSKRGATSPLS